MFLYGVGSPSRSLTMKTHRIEIVVVGDCRAIRVCHNGDRFVVAYPTNKAATRNAVTKQLEHWRAKGIEFSITHSHLRAPK